MNFNLNLEKHFLQCFDADNTSQMKGPSRKEKRKHLQGKDKPATVSLKDFQTDGSTGSIGVVSICFVLNSVIVYNKIWCS